MTSFNDRLLDDARLFTQTRELVRFSLQQEDPELFEHLQAILHAHFELKTVSSEAAAKWNNEGIKFLHECAQELAPIFADGVKNVSGLSDVLVKIALHYARTRKKLSMTLPPQVDEIHIKAIVLCAIRVLGRESLCSNKISTSVVMTEGEEILTMINSYNETLREIEREADIEHSALKISAAINRKLINFIFGPLSAQASGDALKFRDILRKADIDLFKVRSNAIQEITNSISMEITRFMSMVKNI